MGKSIGRVKWPGTTKTIEGTLAFILSILLCAWSLRGLGVVEDFDVRALCSSVTAYSYVLLQGELVLMDRVLTRSSDYSTVGQVRDCNYGSGVVGSDVKSER